MILSDSEPLPVSSLILCQKVDLHAAGKVNVLPILRECIKPGTEIRFTVTVDTGVCDITQESFERSVETFITHYYAKFAKSFERFETPRNSLVSGKTGDMDKLKAFERLEKPKRNYVFCGGGCGFASKTIIYPMYGKQAGIDITQKVFANTGVPRKHKHEMDKDLGIAPHVIKCTRCQGKLYQMGLCSIKMTEKC